MFRRREIPVLGAIAILIAMMLLPGGAARAREGKRKQKESWEAGADKRKSDYVFMEALRRSALDNDAGYFSAKLWN